MEEIVVDNFAGGGGASTGIEIALGRSVDIAINHDPAAIRMHEVNHPTTKHYQEDVWKVDPQEACAGRPVGLAWFSPDCKHFSRAKGGKPVSKKIRGLAWVAVKWAKAVHPRVIMLENVEEFMEWGRLDKDNKPMPEYKGETFRRFVHQLENLGYHVEWNLLRACDYGAPTIRKRFFLIARCDGQPVVWPEPTHGDPDSLEVRAGIKKPWVPVADVLDFGLPCPSIFDTSEEIFEKYGIHAVRPLAENTLKRIAKGLVKFVLDNPNPFVVRVKDRESTPVIVRNNENAVGNDVNKPIGTITTGGHYMMVAPSMIQYHTEQNGEVRGQTVDQPIMTVDASNRYGLVSAFIEKYCQDAENPNRMKMREWKKEKVCDFLIKYYDGSNHVTGCEMPLATITTRDRMGLVQVNECDYQITDIGLRMLTPRELFNAQGFPADYVIDTDSQGHHYNRADQVARCGNAVCPPIPTALVRANLPEMCEMQKGA